MPAPSAPRAGAVRKAVVPANGMGTRLLPVTKAVPGANPSMAWSSAAAGTDTGDKLDYLEAVVPLAAEREDLGPPLRSWLRGFVTDLPANGASPS